MHSFKVIGLVAMATLLMSADGCQNSVDNQQREDTEILLSEAHKQVGMPNIVNFTERKLAKTILELRDTEGLRTWTYIVDMNGELHFLTESIGYGLPYSVQFTNPEKSEWGHQSSHTVPQADPNGLFMPDGLSATWIIAATSKGPKPMYVEPQILVSPIALH